MLLTWRWICFYPGQQTGENQHITILKRRIFVNNTVTSKKAKFTPEGFFSAQIYVMSVE